MWSLFTGDWPVTGETRRWDGAEKEGTFREMAVKYVTCLMRNNSRRNYWARQLSPLPNLGSFQPENLDCFESQYLLASCDLPARGLAALSELTELTQVTASLVSDAASLVSDTASPVSETASLVSETASLVSETVSLVLNTAPVVSRPLRH